jgi:hypothetical protein
MISMQSPRDECTLPRAEADRVVARRTHEVIHGMIRTPILKLPQTLEEHNSARRNLHQQILQLEAKRLEPHTYYLLDVLATRKAAYEILCWRTFPINTLPLEVLERIFVLLLESQNAVAVHRSRMILMSVCSFWRKVVLGTPQM